MANAISFEAQPPAVVEALSEAAYHEPRALQLVENDLATHNIDYVHGLVTVPGAKKPVPYTLAVPKELQSPVIGIGVNGFGATKRTSRDFRDAMADTEGIAMLTYDPARVHSSHKDDLKHLTNAMRLPYDTIEAIAHDVKRNPDLKRTAQSKVLLDAPLALMPNSMGGKPAADFAADHPDDVDLVLYIASIGAGQLSFPQLATRSLNVIGRDILPNMVTGRFGRSMTLARREVEYFARNPIRTVGEIIACSRADIVPQVEYLASLGVKQAMLCMENDDYFYPEDANKAVGNYIDITLVTNSRHCAMQTQSRRIAQHAGSIIRQLSPIR